MCSIDCCYGSLDYFGTSGALLLTGDGSLLIGEGSHPLTGDGSRFPMTDDGRCSASVCSGAQALSDHFAAPGVDPGCICHDA